MNFLVTGHGRSGTKWIATFLNECGPEYVLHEPMPDYDPYFYHKTYNNEGYGRKFISEREAELSDLDYGEVNSYLRYCLPSVVDRFGNIPVAIVIRNGKDVVNSLWQRGRGVPTTLYESSPLGELGYTPYSLGALSWYWAETYNVLVGQKDLFDGIFRFEHLIESKTICSRFCDTLGVDFAYNIWEEYRHREINKNAIHTRRPIAWNDGQLTDFYKFATEAQNLWRYI